MVAVVVSSAGRKLAGQRDATSELQMHVAVYARRPDVGAIVHAHPPKATGFAVAGVPLAQCVLPEVILTLGEVPLAGYATPTTDEVARSVSELVSKHNAVLLSNHGALTLGGDIQEAYYRMETVEHFAEITLAARALGGPNPLSSDDVRKLMNVRENLGLSEGGEECVSCGACDSDATGTGAGEAAGTQKDPARPDAALDEEVIVKAVLDRLKKTLER